jgi:triacylglycerol lipase
MTAQATSGGSLRAPLRGELRYSRELARLLADRSLHSSRRRPDAPPVLLIPGFMAGDGSLTMLRQWLRRRGHRVSMSGMRVNVGCAGELVTGLEERLQRFTADAGQPVFLIGQSRGGALARALAVRQPESVSGLIMLGSPVCDSLAVSAPVLRTVRWIARAGDLGIPGVFSTRCRDGTCCTAFREELAAPLAGHIGALAVHSRSDGIVDWRACLDPYAEPVEVDSSHCGMSVHPDVYKLLERALDPSTERAWSG